MRIFAFLFLFSGIFAAFAAAVPARAAEQLPFGAAIGGSSGRALDLYLQSSTGRARGDLLVAPADLNEDGLSEFIVRDKDCAPACRFTILAENDEKVTSLGIIEARVLAMGDRHSNGVRTLLAYKSAANDYDYTVYVWEPSSGQYMMAGQK
ncbi:MAG: hypothetical protein WBK55_04150 [Alphaproteobacteria bacterium]